MKFILLRDHTPPSNMFVLNVDRIVVIEPLLEHPFEQKEATCGGAFITILNKDGEPRSFQVEETFDEIVEKLKNHRVIID